MRSPQASTEAPSEENDLEELYIMQAEICRVLGHPRRIHILDILAEQERTASQLRASLGIGKVSLSQHLSLLKQAGLIRSRQHGRETSYCIAIPEITGACQLVRKVLTVRLQQGTRLAKTLEASNAEGAADTRGATKEP
jgi:ArsR family transcriptional regulator